MTLCPSSEEYLSNGTAFYLSFTLCAADDKLKMQSIKSGGKSSMTLTLKDVMRLSWLYLFRYICREDWSSLGATYEDMYTKALALFQFIVPLSVFVFTYTSIAVVIWCHRIPGEAENCRDQRIAKSKRKVSKLDGEVSLDYCGSSQLDVELCIKMSGILQTPQTLHNLL
ncbi:hypothetical protein QE152_g38011 [Popillia japonica]|uniref:Uncharacterized protein n=1 Tax=Popillia japonica TaxID=7064 RepID=A0AAW1I963_POPJA